MSSSVRRSKLSLKNWWLPSADDTPPVDDDLYREAERLFGSTGLFDIAAVMGVYQTVCSMLALFEVPAPV